MSNEDFRIDIDHVLRTRLARYYRFIPRLAVRWLERLVCQDQLNDMLDKIGDKRDVDAADVVLHELDITVDSQGMENIPQQGRFIFASNHPLGGLDGLALISIFGHHYDGNIRFLVNDLLMSVKPLRGIFLPVNKFGRQSRQGVSLIEKEYASDHQMLTFPAGLCSRRQPDGSIADLRWHKFVITSAIQHHRDVVPVYFDGQNSSHFYRMAQWRKRLGIKANLEQALLPGEVFKSRGAHYTVHVGRPISWQKFDTQQAARQAATLRDIVYHLQP